MNISKIIVYKPRNTKVNYQAASSLAAISLADCHSFCTASHSLVIMVRFEPLVTLLASLPLFSSASAIPLAAQDSRASAPLLQKASQHEIEHARRVVRDALSGLSEPNEVRSEPSLEIRAAAALVAEADAAVNSSPFLAKRATPYWMETVAHRGSFPEAWGGSSDYQVFRNVKDFGAKGDGVTVSCCFPISMSMRQTLSECRMIRTPSVEP